MPIFFAGLILFFLGLEGNKTFLKQITASRITALLEILSGNFLLAIVTGIIITTVLQSSSAVSVILISLLEGKIIKLKPATGILLGANIGTTVTIQIISLPILSLYPYFITTGILLAIYGTVLQHNKFKYTGFILLSFGAVFAGIQLMSAAFLGNSGKATLSRIIKSVDNKYTGIIAGTLLTALVQSSSIVSGTTLSLATNNLLGLSGAAAITLGSNVGTCVTAFLASWNCSTQARLLALIHLTFNLSGIILLLFFFDPFLNFVTLTSSQLTRQIANAHTLFNTFHLFIFAPLFLLYINRYGGDYIWKS